jgi:ATP-dependent Clp protease ATP-binding subunit ClpC
MEKYAVSRLIGRHRAMWVTIVGRTAHGRIRRKPYSWFLLDEIEKAESDIFNLLLQVFDEGALTGQYGPSLDFRNNHSL